MNILHALDDAQVFRPFFKGDTWDAWRVFLSGLFALPMTAEQAAIYQAHTGRSTPPSQASLEAWLVCGRRSGKSFILAVIAVFLACFRDWRPYLGPGERGTVMVVAADRKQARVIMRYIVGLLRSVPMLSPLIEGETQERVDLKNRVTIEVHTASFRSTRGYTIVAGLLDELAFWSGDDSAEPDVEVINALRPGMATVPGAMLLCASSPYARRGALFNAWRKHHGKDGDPVLVWHAPTRSMNPSVPQGVIDAAMDRDPAHASAEYLAEFRSDIESFIKLDEVSRCVTASVEARPPLSSCRYRAFVDPSGGSNDSMTLAIAHRETDKVVIDRVIERKPPFSPASVVEQFAGVLKHYHVNKIMGDRYAGEWAREPFRRAGITYDVAAKAKSDLYVAFLPLLTSQLVELVDQPRLIQQIVGLERRTARGGRDSIDHAPNGHDDLSNAVAGVCSMFENKSRYDSSMLWVDGGVDLKRQEQLNLNAYIMRGGV